MTAPKFSKGDRASYEAQRRKERDTRVCREERGLPHHPDGSGWAMCPACQGAGEHVHNDSHCNDPQDEYPVECDTCLGEGIVDDGGRDALIVMRAERHQHRWWGREPIRAIAYASARKRAMRPVLGQLRMIEAAVGCTVACEAALDAWRKAA